MVSHAPVCWQHGSMRRYVKCVTEDHALMWGGAVMSVKCVMVSHALLWRRICECEVRDGESYTDVVGHDVMTKDVTCGVWCSGRALEVYIVTAVTDSVTT